MNHLIDSLSSEQLSQYVHQNKDCLKNCTESELLQLFQKINPYNQVVEQQPQKPVLFSITNMKEEYIKRHKMLSLVKFIDRMLFEYEHIADKLQIDKEKQQEYKAVTKQFFDYLFKYDPKFCVRSAYQDKAKNDTERESVTEEQKKELPSLDVFERWTRFEQTNSNEIQKEMDNFFAIKSDFEFAIQIYGVFDTESQAETFKNTHGPGLSMDMYKACTNKWILLNTTEECIDKIKFYNKDNEILENMISQMKKDAEIGHKMIDKRKLEAGVQNAKLNGNIDTEKLNYYFENMQQEPVFLNNLQQQRQKKQELFGINEGFIDENNLIPDDSQSISLKSNDS